VVIANVRDGSTCIFDLINPEDRQSLAGLIRAELVTGLSLHFGGTVASLPAPRRFKQPQFGFELAAGGRAERVFCQAEGVRIALTRTLISKHVRCDLVRTGAMRYNPGQ
jgi:hypothetical protein